MSTLEVKLNLPASLANEARRAGLLTPKNWNGWCAKRCVPSASKG